MEPPVTIVIECTQGRTDRGNVLVGVEKLAATEEDAAPSP